MTPKAYIWLFLCTLVQLSNSEFPGDVPNGVNNYGSNADNVIELFMPKVRPSKNDDYLCTAKSVAALGTEYIHKFEPNADASRAHHMLLFTCDQVEDELLNQGHWDCAHHYSACRRMRIIYAWAKNAPPTILPVDTGFRIGPESNISYLVLQVHYAHALPEDTKDESGFKVYVSNQEPKYLAGMMLLLKGGLTIPAHTEKTHGDMNCVLKSNAPIVPFAFRVHTHQWGSVVSGYHVHFGKRKFIELAKGNPQWPQAFYPMKTKTVINPKDLVAARCTFNSTENDHDTEIGMTAGDEMCNLYIMFYTQSRDPEDHFIECFNEEYQNVNRALPPDSDVPLPRNVTLEEHAHGHHPASSPTTPSPNKSHAKKRPGIQPLEFEEELGSIPQNAIPPEFMGDVDGNILGDDRMDRQLVTKSDYHVVQSWPQPQVKLGQASGTDFDIHGNVVVFHRGDRIWGYNTFDSRNNYMDRRLGPITTDTVYVIHPTTGEILHQWGKNKFYMPHDITVAPNGDTFLTDVALHQVFKFKPGETQASLTLGEAFQPGNDDNHFCKPAAVAALSSGDFFVADGYCNSRIVKFDKNGRKLLQWGRPFRPSLAQRIIYSPPPPYTFSIPHALALAEDQDLLCVADRENGRIQCFSASEGKFKFMIKSPAFGARLFSVAYSALDGGTLFAVNGQEATKVQGFVIPLSTKRVSSVFSPNSQGFGQPHDIAVNKNGSEVYVVEISRPYKVWKFEKNIAPVNKDTEGPLSLPITSSGKSASSPAHPNHVKSLGKEGDGLEEDSFSSSVMIMAFLTIPLLFLVGIGALMRLRSSVCCNRRKETKSFAEFFPPSAGFEKLRMDEESETENSDTEIEEFTKPGFRKSLKT